MSDPNEIMREAIKNLRVEWVVRQQVSTVNKSWLVDLSTSKTERAARMDYDRHVRDNPDSYFELVVVMSAEVCKAFTPHKGAGSAA